LGSSIFVRAEVQGALEPPTPEILGKLIEAAARHGDPLRSKKGEKDGGSYHLRSAIYVGSWVDAGKKVHLGQFMYMTAPKHEEDNAQLQGYLVFFDDLFKPKLIWKLPVPGIFEMKEGALLFNGETVLDLSQIPGSDLLGSLGQLVPSTSSSQADSQDASPASKTSDPAPADSAATQGAEMAEELSAP
jgi:hypothetical protein